MIDPSKHQEFWRFTTGMHIVDENKDVVEFAQTQAALTGRSVIALTDEDKAYVVKPDMSVEEIKREQ